MEASLRYWLDEKLRRGTITSTCSFAFSGLGFRGDLAKLMYKDCASEHNCSRSFLLPCRILNTQERFPCTIPYRSTVEHGENLHSNHLGPYITVFDGSHAQGLKPCNLKCSRLGSIVEVSLYALLTQTRILPTPHATSHSNAQVSQPCTPLKSILKLKFPVGTLNLQANCRLGLDGSI